MRLYDITDPAHPTQLGEPLTGPSDYVYAVAFSPDGRSLAAASTDGTVWLWDVTRPKDPKVSATLTGRRRFAVIDATGNEEEVYERMVETVRSRIGVPGS